MAKKWKLTDVFNYNRYEHNFQVGDVVKVIITDLEENYGEGFWVIITEAKGEQPEYTNPENNFTREATGNREFRGKVDNVLLNSDYPKLGEIIEFNLGHIVGSFEAKIKSED